MRAALPASVCALSSGHSPTAQPSTPSTSAAQIQRPGLSFSTSMASSEMKIGAV